MLGEIQFVMVNGFINERPIPLVGFVGENDARQIKVVTFDDMSTVSVTELVIGDIEAGIFETEQKTIPVFDRLSGAYVDRTQTTLSIYLNEEMLGDSGLKFLQLVMYNETGEIVKKTNQFIVRVGDSNTPVYYAPETKTVKTLETYVKDADKEIANLVFGLQEEVTSSNDFVNKKVPYVYKGNEEDYQNGYWYYYDDTQKRWVPGGPYKNPTDEVLRLLAQKQDALTFDSTPTEDSQNPVTSDGVFRALAGHQITMDEFPINGSTNPVTSDGLYRKFGEVDAQHQSLSTRVGRIQEEQTELANGVQQNAANISQNTANISSQGTTIAEHQTSISENTDAIEEVRSIANSASTKADAIDDRLDNIIVESGTSYAETIAARTNTNTGITYTTLGQRLDEENSEIKEDLSTINKSTFYGGENLFNPFDPDIEYNRYYVVIAGTGGKQFRWVESTEFCESGYIPVSAGDSWEGWYLSPYARQRAVALALYDKDKNLIGGVYKPADDYTFPAGVAYVRVPVKYRNGRNLLSYVSAVNTEPRDEYLLPKTHTLMDAICSVDGSQWCNKKWYAYGTSITNIANEGKYATYLAAMSHLHLTNKGVSGGGIGNLGAYSKGQVYNAVCNTTDGKTEADLITLETGANDCNANVPLGTVYDTGRETLAGCLNDCIRYLQTNTDAQIVVINSPATKTQPNAENQYYEWAKMVREICNINRIYCITPCCNLGYGKLTSDTGSLYVEDTIHQTNLGGYIYANSIWMALRSIPLFYTKLPLPFEPEDT